MMLYKAAALTVTAVILANSPNQAQAQLSNVPKRYRSAKSKVVDQFGRRQQTSTTEKREYPRRYLRAMESARELEDEDLSLSMRRQLVSNESLSFPAQYLRDEEGI